uniref:Uncharacterized protein n=1 Tax=Clastoptera arizonana TaxID=38151 RepID=A0A1B6C0D1_9HEMI
MKKLKNKQTTSITRKKKNKFNKSFKSSDQHAVLNKKKKIFRGSPFKKLERIAKLAKTKSFIDKSKQESSKQIRPQKNNKLENVPLPDELLEKFSRGSGLDTKGVKSDIHKKKFLEKEKNYRVGS